MSNLDKFEGKRILITQIKSVINSDKKQKANIKGLGLRGISSTFETICTKDILGMLNKISHLISIKELKK
jgi:large subunit ribosomal protein L30